MLEKLKENWQTIKNVVRDENSLTMVSYDTWIAPLELSDVKDRIVYIAFTGKSSEFAINYLEKKYTLPFQVAIEEFVGNPITIKFIAKENENNAVLFRKKKEKESSSFIMSETNLNPKFTFDTFVIGSNNQMAHAASLSVAEEPGTRYNPLFIYGGPGLGKTHLMHAIANFILNVDPNKKVMYVTSEVFMNEVIDAIGSRSTSPEKVTSLKKKYREIDVLLIDDIQFIIGRGESTETEFFNTFNFLYERNKQIVISSDKPPKEFINLEERLRSRFEGGLTVDITAPDYETRMAILRKKEERDGYNIDNEILQYIASNIKTNIRELEGALTKIYAFSRLQQNTELSLDVVKDILKDYINPDENAKLTPEKIVSVVADHFGLKPEDLKSKKRTEEIVLPRQIAMYFCRVLTDYTQEEVGKMIGKRNHSTVVYAEDSISKRIDSDENFKNTIDIIKKKLIQ